MANISQINGLQITAQSSSFAATASIAATATTAATASKVTTGLVTTAGTYFIPYVATNWVGNGTNFLGTVGGLTYNPSGGSLTSTSFTGSLSGNATTATTADTASTISITATNTTSATFYPVFTDGQTGARISRTDSGFTFNSLTNALTLSGGSLTATTVTATNLNGTSSYALKGGSGYTIFGQVTTALANPADSQTYYGGHAANSSLSSTAGARKMYVPKTGFVRDAQIFVYNVAGSSELSTFWLVLNGATSSSIGTANHSATAILVSNYALNVSVTQGDYLEFKWVTPAWGTNPTSVTCAGHVLIEEV